MIRRVFLKLGGSLITDKHQPATPRPDIIERLANEIKMAMRINQDFQLIIGHGSGSFGHIPAKQHQTREGVYNPQQWKGFLEVYRQARKLNQIVFDLLSKADLPIIAFPPSAIIQAENKQVTHWNTQPLVSALEAGFIPLVNGDVVFDSQIGGTILSTEDVFIAISSSLPPTEVLLCGIEEGVYADFPSRSNLIREIKLSEKDDIFPLLQGSVAPDVTGGMVEKVRLMLDLVETHPHLRAAIFSGLAPGNLQNALLGMRIGTSIIKE